MKTFIIFNFILLATSCGENIFQSNSQKNENLNKDLVVVYGQSNAVGSAYIDENIKFENNSSGMMYVKCLINNKYVKNENCGALQKIKNPTDIYQDGGFSSFTSFASNMESLGRNIILINAAVGGTKIKELLPGNTTNKNGTIRRFENLIWAFQNTIDTHESEIDTISLIFLQGESNASKSALGLKTKKEVFNEFKTYFEDLYKLRNKLIESLKLVDLNFYIVRIGIADGDAISKFLPDYMNDLGYWQIKFACEKEGFFPLSILPRTFSSNNQMLTDGIHYSTEAYDDLGLELSKYLDDHLNNNDISNFICSDNEFYKPYVIKEKPF